MSSSTSPGSSQLPTHKRRGLISIHEERLERKLVLAFGFMSIIPLLITWAWGIHHGVDMSQTLAKLPLQTVPTLSHLAAARMVYGLMAGAVLCLGFDPEYDVNGNPVDSNQNVRDDI